MILTRNNVQPIKTSNGSQPTTIKALALDKARCFFVRQHVFFYYVKLRKKTAQNVKSHIFLHFTQHLVVFIHFVCIIHSRDLIDIRQERTKAPVRR